MSKDEVKELTYDQKIDLIRNGNLWCLQTCFIGIVGRIQKIIFSKEFLVFAIFTYLFFKFGNKNDLGHWIVYGTICIVFITAEALINLIGQNTKLNIEAKAGLDVKGDLNSGVQQVIEGVKI